MQNYYKISKRLWFLLKPFHKHFYIQLFLIVILQAIGIGLTFILAKSLDALISKNINTLIYMSILYPVISIIVNRISLYSEEHRLRHLTNNVQQYLEEFSFKNVFKLNISQYVEDHSAIKLQVINRGERSAQDVVEMLILTMLPTVTQTLFGLIAISIYSPLVALWCFITLLIIIFWSNKFSEYHRPFIRENTTNWDTQRKVRTEAFQHLSLIKLFAAESSYLKKYLDNRLQMLEHSIFTWRKSILHGHKRGLFMIFSRTFSYILIFRQALTGIITTGSVIAVWSWMNDIYSNIGNIVRSFRQMPLWFVELEKYLDIIDKEAEFVEGGEIKFINGDIVLEDVSLQYVKSETLSLNKLNLIIKKGQKVAIVGVSGGGKSSLIKLLLRSYDYSQGSITIGGVELRDFDYKSLRSHIGYVEQNVDLFDTSVKENLLLGLTRDVSESELLAVVKSARISEFAHRLGEKGLDTEIGERGIKLSGGERQRVGIARALIRNPDILIFDEATSALDTENESFIKEAIDEASKGRTTIIIAHRLSTVRDADKIIVMDKGTVVAEGTHDELLEKSTHYQTLVAHQLSE